MPSCQAHRGASPRIIYCAIGQSNRPKPSCNNYIKFNTKKKKKYRMLKLCPRFTDHKFQWRSIDN